MRKLVVKNFPVTFGGEQPTGWIPINAATPPPTPVQTISLDFAIEALVGGALLIVASTEDGIANDYWYNSVTAAIEGAAKRFDVPAGLWREDVTNGN